MNKYKIQIEEIKQSGLFDESYYSRHYPDAKDDLIEHFLKYGGKRRNPSKHFDTKYYLKTNPDVAMTDFNPLIHYIRHGKKEGRYPRLPKYYLTLAGAIRGDNKDFEKWLAYYRIQGVEHFYINIKNVTKEVREKLRFWIKNGLITIYENLTQKDFYQAIIDERSLETQWCLIADNFDLLDLSIPLRDYLYKKALNKVKIELSSDSYIYSIFKLVHTEINENKFNSSKNEVHRENVKIVNGLEMKILSKINEMIERIHLPGKRTMFPALSEKEHNLLIQYLKKSTNYLEFGSGGSTVTASLHVKNSVISVDSYSKWQEMVIDECLFINSPILPKMKLIDLGPVGDWGYPLNKDKKLNWTDYHSKVWEERLAKSADLVFIDGRFRVACFIEALLHCGPNTVFIIHDFDRRNYQIIKELAIDIDNTEKLYVFRRCENFNVVRALELLEKYKYELE